MEIGMNLPVMAPGFRGDALLAWAQGIDAGPFSTLAAGERITFPCPEMLTALTAAAAVTRRVRILTNVLVLPMHDAVHAAKRLATLDHLCGGRLVVGLGAGARAEDYAALGVPFDGPRLSRLEQGVARLRAAWAGAPPAAGAARPVEPAPLRPEGPPLLAGSLSPRAIARAARWADGVTGFSFGPDPREVEGQCRAARDAWQAAGREHPPRLVANCWFALGPGARPRLERYLAAYLDFLGPGVGAAVASGVRITDAGALRDVVRELDAVGVDELCLVPTTWDTDELARAADVLA